MPNTAVTTLISLPEAEPDVSIVNVVLSVTMNHGFDLDEIYKQIPETTYRPEVFPGLCLRLKRPKATTLIFHTGKMVCTGARSEGLARSAVSRVLRELRSKGITARGRPEITVQNIVATADLGARVDLDRAAYLLDHSMYEPEMFPGLIYRMPEPRVTLLIFHNGKLVITGAKREAHVSRATNRILEILMAQRLFYTVTKRPMKLA